MLSWDRVATTIIILSMFDLIVIEHGGKASNIESLFRIQKVGKL